jgi:hypothetical protein
MSVTLHGKLSGNLMRLPKPTAVFHPRKEASPPPSIEPGTGLMDSSKKRRKKSSSIVCAVFFILSNGLHRPAGMTAARP